MKSQVVQFLVAKVNLYKRGREMIYFLYSSPTKKHFIINPFSTTKNIYQKHFLSFPLCFHLEGTGDIIGFVVKTELIRRKAFSALRKSWTYGNEVCITPLWNKCCYKVKALITSIPTNLQSSLLITTSLLQIWIQKARSIQSKLYSVSK